MKSKLTHYLTKENESLNDILTQTKEIKKSLNKEDITTVNRILTGREKNITLADKYQKAIVEIFDRTSDESLLGDTQVIELKESMISMLREINALDEEIGKTLVKKHAESKDGYKKTKEISLLKKSYKSYNAIVSPKVFDEKL